jgi:hypothetical protein
MAFLGELERLVPPPPNCHHAIMAAKYGSDVVGWEDKLAVQVNDGGVFRCYFVEPDDFTKTPEALAAEMRASMDARHQNEQFGVALGQFVQ